MLRLVVNFVNPAIPIRSCDWEAYVDGREESEIGRGATKQSAIDDLVEQIAAEVA
jgi:hypothetical protein